MTFGLIKQLPVFQLRVASYQFDVLTGNLQLIVSSNYHFYSRNPSFYQKIKTEP